MLQFYTERELSAVKGGQSTMFMDKLKLAVTKHFREEEWDSGYYAAMSIKSALENLSLECESEYLHRWWSPKTPRKLQYKRQPNILVDGITYVGLNDYTREQVKTITDRKRVELVKCLRALRPYFRQLTVKVGIDVDEQYIEVSWVLSDEHPAPNQLILHRSGLVS